jgi:hypothetical protein
MEEQMRYSALMCVLVMFYVSSEVGVAIAMCGAPTCRFPCSSHDYHPKQ